MESNSSAMLFQYCATCAIVSLLDIPASLQIMDRGRLGQPAVTKTREWPKPQQLAPALLRFGEVSIVAQTRLEGCTEARLAGIEFPGMDVTHHRHAITPGLPHT